MSVLSKKFFHNEAAAFAHLEKILWQDSGPVCPHCGSLERSGRLEGVKDKKGRVRLGLWKCYECRSQYTIRVGTVFESAHIPLSKMLQAVYLMASSKKGISAHQLHRTLGVTFKTAWFLAHRIREAMRTGGLAPLGGAGVIVEADETFLGNEETHRARKGKRVARGPHNKRKILSLVQRNGECRSFHITDLRVDVIAPIVRQNIRRESILSTDEARYYRKLGKEFAGHLKVEHGDDEYVRGDAHVNTAESLFSIFKRGMKGIYQHCGEQHLHRYLAEFDFRYNHRVALGYSDEMRAGRAVKGIVGKRLTYRNPDEARQV